MYSFCSGNQQGNKEERFPLIEIAATRATLKYSALGCDEHNELAKLLGLELKEGKLLVDNFQQTSMKGVYAAGDIVSGLNQICVAQGQAAIAACVKILL